MMMNFKIYTNNPDVAGQYPEFARFCAGGVREVFTAVRDAVHLGARVLSHPLSGSIKPNQSPYKSVVVSVGRGALDARSLSLIEDALGVLGKAEQRKGDLAAGILADFRLIDLDLTNSAIQSLA